MTDTGGFDEIKTLTRQSPAHIIVLFTIGLALFAVFFTSESLNKETPARIEIYSFINPNTADKASLQRLNGIGPALARQIIEYRERTNLKPAFKKPDDLQKVRGIGPKKTEDMRPLLEIQ